MDLLIKQLVLFMSSFTARATNATVLPESAGVKDFVSLHPQMATEGIAACQSPFAETCELCTVNMDPLRNDTHIRMPDGTVLNRITTIPSSSIPGRTFATFNGSSMSTSAYITYGDSTNYVNGEIQTPLGSYDLVNCGANCHVWIKEDSSYMEEVEEKEDSLDTSEGRSLIPTLQVPYPDSLDRQTLTEVSVRVYFTPAFQTTYGSDVMGFISDLIEVTNTGFANSEIPVRVKLLCAEFLNLIENEIPSRILFDFERAKGTVHALRNTADIAFLLHMGFYPGHAYKDTDKFPLGVANDYYARSRFTFGGMIATIFGADINIEENPTPHYPYAHAYIIKSRRGGGFRTIKAFPVNDAFGYTYERVNYYSSDTVRLPNGLPTGNANSDNARVITMNRARQAAVGDESAICVPTDGRWSSWGSWTCPYTCGSSRVQIRRRACNNAVPLNGGQDCFGPDIEAREQFCLRKNCATSPRIDGMWSAWVYDQPCPTCGNLMVRRSRTCTNPAPHNGGSLCSSYSPVFQSQFYFCRNPPCEAPICSTLSGLGTQTCTGHNPFMSSATVFNWYDPGATPTIDIKCCSMDDAVTLIRSHKRIAPSGGPVACFGNEILHKFCYSGRAANCDGNNELSGYCGIWQNANTNRDVRVDHATCRDVAGNNLNGYGGTVSCDRNEVLVRLCLSIENGHRCHNRAPMSGICCKIAKD